MYPYILDCFIFAVFLLGYLGIIFEMHLKVNKSAVALFSAVICWVVYFLGCGYAGSVGKQHLARHLSGISEILFFLIGAMALVELIDSHKGFTTIVRMIHSHSKRKVLWVVAFLSFFLSSVLDNLTTTILMLSVLKKVVPHKKERLFLSCMVVIASNAGGAWTPIGDVTTTMLWIEGQVSALGVVRELFIPSLVAMLLPLLVYTFSVQGFFPSSEIRLVEEKPEPGANLVFFSGILGLIFVPIFKSLTGLPPFMGMLLSLSVLWFITDRLHHRHEHRQHLRIPHILTKIDVSSILFFLGILLGVNALEAVGTLAKCALWLDHTVESPLVISTSLGLLSAVIDNVPLVAASMGMYDLAVHAMDSPIWILIAYAAGTGGSIFAIGSSAGVALMSVEKVDFIAYAKRATLPALLGYFGGLLTYVLLRL